MSDGSEAAAASGSESAEEAPAVVAITERWPELAVAAFLMLLAAIDIVAVSFALYGNAVLSMTHSGRSLPARQCDSASIGLLTVESTCLPTSWTATSPPPL